MSNPVNSLLIWKFQQNFLHSPAQRSSVFANRVASEMLSGQNQFQDIYSQVDGIDFNPASSDLNFSETPFLTFNTKRIGYRKRGHAWGHAVPTEDWHRTQTHYQSNIPVLAAQSFARWRDRVLLNRCADDYRLVATAGATTTTNTELPEGNKYALVTKPSSGNATWGTLDLAALQHARLHFFNNEIDKEGGDMGGGMAVCAASPHQIQGLLNEDKVINADYASIKALVRGEVNTYMGFEFIRTKAGGKTRSTANSADSEDRKTVAFYKTDGETRDIKNATATDYSQIGAQEKVVFSYPQKAFAFGILPRAGYMNVWQNPNRGGTWEYFVKDSIGYKRCLDEYVLVMYGSAGTGGVDIRSSVTGNSNYYENYKTTLSGSNWSYSNTPA